MPDTLSDNSLAPSRRNVLKAGLWVAPAVVVVNMTAVSAAHASGTQPPPPCITTYPSFGFVVFEATGVRHGDKIFYAFKFGDGTSTQPVVEGIGMSKAFEYLSNTSPYNNPNATVIGNPGEGTAAQQAEWTRLLGLLTVVSYTDSTGSGYKITAADSSLVAVFVHDGTFSDNAYMVHPVASTSDGYRLTKCA